MKRFLGALAALSLLPAAAYAQVGVVRGIVYDSLAREPLARARVMIRGTAIGATTDNNGRFQIDDAPVGRRTLFVEHPALDSIGISNLAANVEISENRPSIIDLGIPSLRTMTRAACGTSFMRGDSGMVYGRVIDVHSGQRLANARVVVSWLSATTTAGGIEIGRPSLDVRSDSVGNYYVCGVPNEMFITVRAFAGQNSTGSTERLIGPRFVARHDLAVNRNGSNVTDTASGMTRGRAVLTGVVRDTEGRPRPSARVMVDDAMGEAFADSSGRFFLPNMPAGTQMVMARMIGYSTSRLMVDLKDTDTTHAVFEMRAINVLDTIRVTTSRFGIAQLDEIDQRERAGLGYRLREPDLRNKSSMRSALQSIPNLVIEGPSTSRFELLTRVASGYCRPRLFIDGMRGDTEQLQAYRPDQIIGVEFFPRRSEVPIRFSEADNLCGVVLVWTRFIR